VSELIQGVPEGNRSDSAARLAGYIAEKRIPEDIAFEFLTPFAGRCRPPFPLSELRGVVASIYRKHQHADAPRVEEVQPVGRFTFPLSKLLSAPEEPIPYLADGLLVAAANGFIGGEPKSLKSWVALHLALCLSLGIPIFGRYQVPQRGRVLFISEEDGERRVRSRIRKLLKGLGTVQPEDGFFRYSIKAGVMFDEPEWIDRLRGDLAEYKPAIVVADVFELMHGQDADKRADMKPVFRDLDRLREEFGCGFLLTDHFKKASMGTSRRGGQRLSGTVGKHAWGENSLYLFPVQGKNRVRVDTELKDGPSEVFGLALEDTEDGGVVFTWQAEAEDQASIMKAKALAAVEELAPDGLWVTAKQVAEVMGVKPNTAKKYLDLLVDEDQKLERELLKVAKTKAWHWRLRA
jgi:RecA-family ATPase